MASQTSLTGAAGEHFVMFQLLSRGFIGALAPEGVPNMDIMVTSIDGQQLSSIQVKSRWAKGADGGWHMGKKHEAIIGDRLFYCFVDLGEEFGCSPKTYIVPSTVVAEAVRLSHETWLNTPGLRERKRNDSNVRRFLPDYSKFFRDQPNPYPLGWLDEYAEAWSLLRTPSPR